MEACEAIILYFAILKLLLNHGELQLNFAMKF